MCGFIVTYVTKTSDGAGMGRESDALLCSVESVAPRFYVVSVAGLLCSALSMSLIPEAGNHDLPVRSVLVAYPSLVANCEFKREGSVRACYVPSENSHFHSQQIDWISR